MEFVRPVRTVKETLIILYVQEKLTEGLNTRMLGLHCIFRPFKARPEGMELWRRVISTEPYQKEFLIFPSTMNKDSVENFSRPT